MNIIKTIEDRVNFFIIQAHEFADNMVREIPEHVRQKFIKSLRPSTQAKPLFIRRLMATTEQKIDFLLKKTHDLFIDPVRNRYMFDTDKEEEILRNFGKLRNLALSFEGSLFALYQDKIDQLYAFYQLLPEPRSKSEESL